jgi:MFS family permease
MIRLTSGSLLLFFGSIADLFGRKTMFIGSMFLFSVFCLGAGFSQSGMTLDILCGVLGIWSASAVPPAQGMLGTIYEKPSPRKNRAFGCFSAGNPLGFVFGTILAGLFTQIFSWRAGFFLLAIVYLCTTVVAYFMVPKDTTAKQSLNDETLKKLDLQGTGMAILGIGMFCAALRWVHDLKYVDTLLTTCSLASDAPQGWRTPYVLVLLVIGLLLMAAFVVWEIRYPFSMIDMNIWTDRDFSLVSLENPDAQLQLIGTAIRNHSLWLHWISGILVLDCTVLPDGARLLRPHDWCTHAANGCLRLGRKPSRCFDPT